MGIHKGVIDGLAGSRFLKIGRELVRFLNLYPPLPSDYYPTHALIALCWAGWAQVNHSSTSEKSDGGGLSLPVPRNRDYSLPGVGIPKSVITARRVLSLLSSRAPYELFCPSNSSPSGASITSAPSHCYSLAFGFPEITSPVLSSVGTVGGGKESRDGV